MIYTILYKQIASQRINSRRQVDKEALWLTESPTYLSVFRLSYVYVDFIFERINTLALTQSADNYVLFIYYSL